VGQGPQAGHGLLSSITRYSASITPSGARVGPRCISEAASAKAFFSRQRARTAAPIATGH
jgi:hypothetical protein